MTRPDYKTKIKEQENIIDARSVNEMPEDTLINHAENDLIHDIDKASEDNIFQVQKNTDR